MLKQGEASALCLYPAAALLGLVGMRLFFPQLFFDSAVSCLIIGLN